MVETSQTEADLEARMHAVLAKVFPWIPSDGFAHQTSFSITLGHATLQVDGRANGRRYGRADILISSGGKPLAILELKRTDLELTPDDVSQGLSYARLTTVITPLVIVSNGLATQIYESYSGEEWTPADRTQREFQLLLERVGNVAASDLRSAVRTLMGPTARLWLRAFQRLSAQLIEERTGDWSEPSAPFVQDFLISRHVTKLIVHLTAVQIGVSLVR